MRPPRAAQLRPVPPPARLAVAAGGAASAAGVPLAPPAPAVDGAAAVRPAVPPITRRERASRENGVFSVLVRWHSLAPSPGSSWPPNEPGPWHSMAPSTASTAAAALAHARLPGAGVLHCPRQPTARSGRRAVGCPSLGQSSPPHPRMAGTVTSPRRAVAGTSPAARTPATWTRCGARAYWAASASQERLCARSGPLGAPRAPRCKASKSLRL